MAAELATTLATTEADRLLQAESLVRGYCGWHIAPLREGVEVTVDGSGSQILPLPTLHLAEVTAVTEDGATVDLGGVQWTEAGYLWRAAAWTRNLRGVVVTMNHGHATVPPEVQGVVQAVAQRAVNNPDSIVRRQDGPFSDTYSQTGFNQSLPLALLEAEKVILDRYRLPSLP